MKAFRCYVDGEADEELINLFAFFGLEYDKRKRIDYLLVFSVLFLKERVSSSAVLPALVAYCDLIEGMVLEARGVENET